MRLKSLSFLFLLGVTSAYSQSKEITRTSLQLAWKHQWQFAGYYIAKEKGFFKDAGLNVDIIEYDTGTHITDAVVSGAVDFGVGRSSLISDRSEGKKVVMLASIFQHSPIILLTKKRDDLQDVTDLRGKKIMLTQDQVGMASINALLISHGIKQGMFQFQRHSFNVQDLIDGRTDALLAYSSNEPYEMKKQNVPYTVFSPKDYNFDFLSDILFTSDALLKTNTELVDRFRKASIDGWKYAIQNPEETTDLIFKKYNSQGKSRNALEFEAGKIIKLTDYPKVPLGTIDLRRVEYITQIYRLMGLIKGDVNYEDLIYSRGDDGSVRLSAEEKAWIKDNPMVRVGGELDWKPFDFVDNKGNYTGISKDILDLVMKKTGLRSNYITGQKWKGLITDFESGKLDVLPALYHTEDRERYTIFTEPYFKIKDYLFVREDDNTVNSIDDIKDKIVAVIDGYATADNVKEIFPNIKILKVKDKNAGLDAVLLKKADAYIDGYAVTMYTLTSEFITGIKPAIPFGFTNHLRIGVSRNKPVLASIIIKGLDTLTHDNKNRITAKWFAREQKTSKEKQSKLSLTEDETRWLKENPVIRFTGDPSWLPFEAFTEDGHYKGIVADHLRLIENRLGVKFKKVKPASWDDAINKAVQGQVDVISGDIADETLGAKLNYVEPYIDNHLVVVMQKGNKTKGLFSLNKIRDKKIAYISGYGYVSEILKTYPDFNFVQVGDIREGLEKVSFGEIDALLCTITMGTYNISELGLSNLRVVGKTPIVMRMSFAVRKDWNIFHEILNKAIDSIKPTEQREIVQSWIGSDDNKKINLTAEEQAWLNKKKSLSYVYDVDWAPFEWKNELGEHTGIVYDILSLIEKRSGLTLNALDTSSWSEAIDLMKNDQADMYSGVGENPERNEYVNFTKNNIFKTPYVFVSRRNDDSDYLETFSVIENKKVAVVDGYTIHGILKVNVPKLPLLTVKSIGEGFEKVRKRELDIFIVNAPTAKYFINRKGFDDLKIATKTEFNLDLKIALQKEIDPIAISILDKAIASLSEEEIADIYFKWTEVLLDHEIDWTLIYQLTGGAMALLILIGYWNRKLKRTVAEKTKELKEFSESLEGKVKDRTKELNRQLRMLKIAERKQAELMTVIEENRKEVEQMHRHTRDSIEYASLIQHSLIPSGDLFKPFFADHFTVWFPKDVVGGDIFLFDVLRDEDECLLLVIDCTGHGVPGAFVSMLVKAIERQINSLIKSDPDKEVSPGHVLSYFNRTMKHLLKQVDENAISNAGFDGGILYYNKKKNIIRFSGAETPLFYIDLDGKLNTIKGNRHSIGYRSSDPDYIFKDHEIAVKPGMKFFLTTDGYLDQNGGPKGFPMGKKTFQSLIKEHHALGMTELSSLLLTKLNEYRQGEEQNDDVTVVGIEIGEPQFVEGDT